MEKQFDVICMGRVAVDLYSQQVGARLEDASSFAKYLGALAMNIWAASCAKSSTRLAAIPAI